MSPNNIVMRSFPLTILFLIGFNFGGTQSIHETRNGTDTILNENFQKLDNNFAHHSDIVVSHALTNLSENILDTNSPVHGGPKNVQKVVWDTFEAPYEIRKNFPYYHSGYDEESRPIWVIEFGRFNTRKVVEEGGEKFLQLKKYAEQAVYVMTKSVLNRSTPDRPVTESIIIADMDQLDLIQVAHYPTIAFALELSRKYTPLLQRHMHMALVVNTNSVAHTLLNVVKPVFGRIFEKIEVFGTNKAKYIPQILKHCPKSQIPSWYGGSTDFRPIKVYG